MKYFDVKKREKRKKVIERDNHNANEFSLDILGSWKSCGVFIPSQI